MFKHDKLQADKKRIRLLRLLPRVLDNPQINCKVFEAEFNGDRHLVKASNCPIINLGTEGRARNSQLVEINNSPTTYDSSVHNC